MLGHISIDKNFLWFVVTLCLFLLLTENFVSLQHIFISPFDSILDRLKGSDDIVLADLDDGPSWMDFIDGIVLPW